MQIQHHKYVGFAVGIFCHLFFAEACQTAKIAMAKASLRNADKRIDRERTLGLLF